MATHSVCLSVCLPRLVPDSQQSSCLGLTSTGITDKHYHTWLPFHSAFLPPNPSAEESQQLCPEDTQAALLKVPTMRT